MSLKRLVSFEMIVGAGAAFAGWGLAEALSAREGVAGGWFGAPLTCGLVGAAVGAGLSLAAGMANTRWKRLAKRVAAGLIAGGLAGVGGGSLSNIFLGTLRWDPGLGWMIMGAGLGVAEGLFERSPAKLRDGLIGGALGGLAGGLMLGPVFSALSHVSGVAGRAAAFVVLEACVGAVIGLVKVWFAEAWLTVLDGHLPGRQLLLSTPIAVIGRADDAALSVVPRSKAGVDLEHARIVRQTDGRFVLEDNHSRHGTSVNHARVLDRVVLNDGDVITIDGNSIRFRTIRRRRKASGPPVPTPKPSTPSAAQSLGEPPRGMSRCPKCRRLVAGARPYCVECKLSF